MKYDAITFAELQRLADAHGGERVSIYIPTEVGGAATRENPIRYKNALREAEEKLIPLMPRPELARRLLDPGRVLENDTALWENQGRGLAAFVDADGLRTFRLPYTVPTTVAVSNAFHVKPLLPTFTENGSYFLLDLSLNKVRLFHADHNTIDEIDVPDLPSSLDEALWPDQWQDQQQRHTVSAGVGQRGASVTHSSGDESQDRQKEDVVRFFQMVDAALRPILAEEKRPLVLACVANLKPLYDEANSYRNLLADVAAHDPEASRLEDIAQRAWPIAQAYFQSIELQDRNRYGDQISAGRAVSAIDRVVAAALEGRIDTLWVAKDTQVWGHADETTSLIAVHDQQQSGDRDLLDLAAVRALLSGRRLYTATRDAIPDGAVAAAILRY